jgi:5-methylcytosine-specific restriction enzyme A
MALRNPPWHRDELILALDLYMKYRDRLPDHDGVDIRNLSALLNQITKHPQNGRENFRNSNGVYMKLANFRALDERFTSQGKKGLQRGGKTDAAVWADYATDISKLRAAADGIRAAAQNGERLGLSPDEGDDDEMTAPEGELLSRMHRVRERNRKLVARKKADVLRKTGKLCCEACNFDFSAYGERGEGFIEVHHLKPVYSLRPGDRTKLSDLAAVCANCHRMIHARRPWLSLDELKRISPIHP